MKILIYGSTYLTSAVVNKLNEQFDLVGYIPSKNPLIEGKINLPLIKNSEAIQHDIKLSVQYDEKIINFENAYNVHTGILPLWAGRDLMYHTLKEKEVEQGLTFHKMTVKYDYGPIISKITYPVFEQDTVLDLYERQATVAPHFVLSSLNLLQTIGIENVVKCYQEKPRVFYKRKNIVEKDLIEYETTGKRLVEIYGNR